MNSFFGGVRDPLARRGFIPLAPATVVAVDLATGDVLWRQSRIGRPVAATALQLVTLASRGDAFVLRLFDAETGRDMGMVEPTPWPHWADEGRRMDAMEVTASEATDGVRLRWQIRYGYSGGAAPSAAVLAEAEREASGELLVNLETGQYSATPPAAAPQPPPTIDAPSVASVEPSVRAGEQTRELAREQIGSRVFTLGVEVRGASRVVVLGFHDAASGASWDTPIGEVGPARPGPLRK